MFRKIEYLRILDSMMQEEELNDEYGVYGWQLVSVRPINEDTEYIFSRKQPLIFFVLVGALGQDKLFTERALSFHWSLEYLPKIGERFNPIDFLQIEEKDYINRHDKVEDWLTPEGRKMFESNNLSNKEKGLKEETLCDFLHRNINKSVIDALQMSYNSIQQKHDVFIWLANK